MRPSQPQAPGGPVVAFEADLAVAQALLGSDDPPAVAAAARLLAAVDAGLGRLASATETDTTTAGHLLAVRADLSGHLLAAGALQAAGAAGYAAARMLRRAAENAASGLVGIDPGRMPVGTGRR